MEDINKLQEDIIKSDKKNAEKLWKNNVDDSTLDGLLSKMTKDELVKIAKRYSVKGMTTLKKADAVEKLKDVVVNNQDVLLASLEENSLRFLEELINENGSLRYEEDYFIFANFFRDRGVAFTGKKNDELYIVLADEVKEALNGKITKEVRNNARAKSDMVKAIAGMAYYYGVMDADSIKNLLEDIFNVTLSIDEVVDMIILGVDLGYDYNIEDYKVCHIDVMDMEEIEKIQEENSKYFCKYDKKSLIKAGTPDFIEDNKRGANLERALGQMFVIDKEILKDEISCFAIAIKNEEPIEQAINVFLEAYEIDTDEEKDIFSYELEHFAKTIKRWSFNGYSADEIAKMEQKVVAEVKIGRNDPCVCGSGKKYKKCCGK